MGLIDWAARERLDVDGLLPRARTTVMERGAMRVGDRVHVAADPTTNGRIVRILDAWQVRVYWLAHPTDARRWTVERLSVILVLGLLAAPFAAQAQQAGTVPRIGYLWLGPAGSETLTLAGLRQGFRELGYVEGRDLVLESRYADGTPERLPALVADLVRLKVDVILSPGSVVTRAVQQGTSAIPVVSTTGDPVGAGFVKSLARPGGNITGLSLSAGEDSTLAAKQLELLKEVVPTISRVATIVNPTNSGPGLRVLQQAAPALGLRLQPVEARTSADLDRAFAAITAAGADLHLRVVGVYTTHLEAERAGAAELPSVALEGYANDTPPC